MQKASPKTIHICNCWKSHRKKIFHIFNFCYLWQLPVIRLSLVIIVSYTYCQGSASFSSPNTKQWKGVVCFAQVWPIFLVWVLVSSFLVMLIAASVIAVHRPPYIFFLFMYMLSAIWTYALWHLCLFCWGARQVVAIIWPENGVRGMLAVLTLRWSFHFNRRPSCWVKTWSPFTGQLPDVSSCCR